MKTKITRQASQFSSSQGDDECVVLFMRGVWLDEGIMRE